MTNKKFIFTGILLLCMAAVVLTVGAHAQQAGRGQVAAETGMRADYNFAQLTHANPTYGKHESVTGAHYGPMVAFSDTGEATALAEFFDSRTGPVRAIVTTTGRLVVEDGQKIGDITVLRIRTEDAFDLQINKAGAVMWLGLIQAKECGLFGSTCFGLFGENRLLAVTAGTPGGVALSDQGKVTAAANNYMTPAPGGIATTVGKGTAGSIAGSIGTSIWNQARSSIKIPGGKIPVPWSTAPITIGAPTGNGLPGNLPTVSGQPGQPIQAAQQKAQFEAMDQFPNCPTPQGAWPGAWSANANAQGPITSGRQEGMTMGTSFISLLHPAVHRWFRKVYFGADCRMILTAAIESSSITQELWTPVGLVATFDADAGVYHFNGIPPVALPPANTPIESGVLINKRCAVLALVSVKHAPDDESALVIGTPTKPGHCPVE